MAKDARKRVELRVDPKRYDQIKHFADKQNLSVNAWVDQACGHMIDYINADYDVPTAEIERVNQLTDMIQQLTAMTRQLMNININGFDAMSNLMHGTNYLNTDVDDNDQNNGGAN